MKKSIRIIALLLLLSICALTSCEQGMTTEELLKVPFYVDSLVGGGEFTYDFIDESYNFPYTYTYFDGTVENLYPKETHEAGEVITYFDEEYTLRLPISIEPSIRQYDINGECATVSSSENISFCYNYATNEPLEYWRINGQYKFDGEFIDIETAKTIALEYIDTVLNGKYKKGIDIDEYELTFAETYAPDKSHIFKWNLIIKNIIVHTVEINVNCLGEIYYWVALSVPDEELIDRIPAITEEQYIDLAIYHLTKAYENCGNKVTVVNAELDSWRYGSIAYNKKLDNYLLGFKMHYDVINEDGTYEIDRTLEFAIPLDAE